MPRRGSRRPRPRRRSGSAAATRRRPAAGAPADAAPAPPPREPAPRRRRRAPAARADGERSGDGSPVPLRIAEGRCLAVRPARCSRPERLRLSAIGKLVSIAVPGHHGPQGVASYPEAAVPIQWRLSPIVFRLRGTPSLPFSRPGAAAPPGRAASAHGGGRRAISARHLRCGRITNHQGPIPPARIPAARGRMQIERDGVGVGQSGGSEPEPLPCRLDEEQIRTDEHPEVRQRLEVARQRLVDVFGEPGQRRRHGHHPSSSSRITSGIINVFR